MTFRRATPAPHYRALRLLSDEGRWELGLCPYSHGMRLRMGASGCPPKILDFCLGRDPALLVPVLFAVLGILEPLPEGIEATAIDASFPWAGTRPDLAIHLEGLLARRPPGDWPVLPLTAGGL